MNKPLQVLKKYWGYEAFRQSQATIIDTLLEGESVFALLPTGAGKSICFQVPTLISEGVCIVISPLVALMHDQVEILKSKGIKAAALLATLKQNEIIDLFDNLKYGGYKFLYLSPERLQSEFIQEKLRELQVNFIAIDEAHCISEWGHDFRPSYRKVNVLTAMHPQAPVIVLTASATAKVTEDIIQNLQLENIVQFKASLKRPEIHYKVEKTNDIRFKIKSILPSKASPTIIYTSSRKASKTISDYLNNNSYPSGYYHGGLSPDEKQTAYKNWLSEKTPIMVATNAFGMGIDKDNVNTIIHANLPFSIENYLQESGRAGRNGKASSAYLLYNDATVAEFKSQTEKSIISLEFLKVVYKKINQYYQIALGEKPLEPFPFDLAEFCSSNNLPHFKTFNAITTLEKEGILELTESLHKKSSLKFILSQKQLFGYSEIQEEIDKLIKVLLRNYGGLFEHYVKIDEFIISRKLNLEKERVTRLLAQLHNDKIIDYKKVINNQAILFLVPREDAYTINRIADHVKKRQKVKQEKQAAVLVYVENKSICRSRQLLTYFSESLAEDCGTCDVCSSKNSTDKSENYNDISKNVLQLLDGKPLSARELVEVLQHDKDAVLTTLQLLLDKNKISITSQNKFQVN